MFLIFLIFGFALLYIGIGFVGAFFFRKIFRKFLHERTKTRTIFINALGILVTQLVLIILTENFTNLDKDLGFIFNTTPMTIIAIGSGIISFIFGLVESLVELRKRTNKNNPNSILNRKIF